MYGDERPHDKTLKVNAGLFFFFLSLSLLLFLPAAHDDIALL